MAKWLYLICDLQDGDVRGTNELKVAHEFALSETVVVIGVAVNSVIVPQTVVPGGDQVFDWEKIPEQQLYQFSKTK